MSVGCTDGSKIMFVSEGNGRPHNVLHCFLFMPISYLHLRGCKTLLVTSPTLDIDCLYLKRGIHLT